MMHSDKTKVKVSHNFGIKRESVAIENVMDSDLDTQIYI